MTPREYNVEILTPCFCAGAEQQKAEIRVPSIRGQVRWWFRALGGNADDEAKLFGRVHGEACSSTLVFRVPNPPRSDKAVNRNDYLFWPMRKNMRGVLDPCSFRLLTSVRVRESGIRQDLLEQVDVAIRLWILFGAIGTRCRRGAGSLWPKDNPPADIETLGKMAGELLGLFKKPDVKVFALKNAAKSSEEALRVLGDWLKTWRAGSKRSMPDPKQWGINDHEAGLGRSRTVYRPVLGLPLTQRYTETNITMETEYDDADGRWASPLHLKIGRFGNEYVPLVVYFPAHAIPEGAELQIKEARSRGSDHRVILNHDLLRQMLADLQPVWGNP